MTNTVDRGVRAALPKSLGFVASIIFWSIVPFLHSLDAQSLVPVRDGESLVQRTELPAENNELPAENDELPAENDELPVENNDDGQVKNSLKQLLGPLSASVVEVRNRDRLCCLGTIVAEGLVVTKRSELSGSITCVTADGTRIAAQVVASDQGDDLALLRLDPQTLKNEVSAQAVRFEESGKVESGDVLLSVGTNADPLSFGVATVSPQQIPVAQPVCRDCVDLGVTVSVRPAGVELHRSKPGSDWREIQKVFGAKVKRVYPRTVGERVGVLKEDLLISINQQWVSSAAVLRSIGARVRVGQMLNVVVVRGGELKQLSMKVDHFSRRVYHDRWGGGPFSERRFGFRTTIIHDSLLEPNQCGAPLVDLDGNIVGLNIARSMRVATLAVPADRVREFVNRFRYLAANAP